LRIKFELVEVRGNNFANHIVFFNEASFELHENVMLMPAISKLYQLISPKVLTKGVLLF